MTMYDAEIESVEASLRRERDALTADLDRTQAVCRRITATAEEQAARIVGLEGALRKHEGHWCSACCECIAFPEEKPTQPAERCEVSITPNAKDDVSNGYVQTCESGAYAETWGDRIGKETGTELRGREGTARDIQASDQGSGSAEVTLTCKVVDSEPQGIATESPPPINDECRCFHPGKWGHDDGCPAIPGKQPAEQSIAHVEAHIKGEE